MISALTAGEHKTGSGVQMSKIIKLLYEGDALVKHEGQSDVFIRVVQPRDQGQKRTIHKDETSKSALTRIKLCFYWRNEVIKVENENLNFIFSHLFLVFPTPSSLTAAAGWRVGSPPSCWSHARRLLLSWNSHTGPVSETGVCTIILSVSASQKVIHWGQQDFYSAVVCSGQTESWGFERLHVEVHESHGHNKCTEQNESILWNKFIHHMKRWNRWTVCSHTSVYFNVDLVKWNIFNGVYTGWPQIKSKFNLSYLRWNIKTKNKGKHLCKQQQHQQHNYVPLKGKYLNTKQQTQIFPSGLDRLTIFVQRGSLESTQPRKDGVSNRTTEGTLFFLKL